MKIYITPSFAFQVGAYTVDRNGTVTCPDDTDAAQIEMLMRELAHDGYIGERIDQPTKEPASPSLNDIDQLAIELPKDGITPTAMENLRRLVTSKAMLLKKALGTDSLPITEHPDRIEFGWFRPTDDQIEIAAYYQLVQGLCALARSQQRVNAKERVVENERYALRVFLLRLGFIGPEYRNSRAVLLRNLSGSAAFKGAKETEDEA